MTQELLPVTPDMQEAYAEWEPPAFDAAHLPSVLGTIRAAFYGGWSAGRKTPEPSADVVERIAHRLYDALRPETAPPYWLCERAAERIASLSPTVIPTSDDLVERVARKHAFERRTWRDKSRDADHYWQHLGSETQEREIKATRAALSVIPSADGPSCHGLNTSCPDGCGRDPATGELNGTRLVSANERRVFQDAPLIEPSDDEQSTWPPATCDYVRGLELRLATADERQAQIVGWRDIATAPVKGDNDETQRIVMAYFGPDERYHGAAAVGHLFKWDCMERRLASNWPWPDHEPTHWMPLPAAPDAIERNEFVKGEGK